MRATIEGTLLEKSVLDKVYDGKQVHKKVFMLYQRGEKNNAQVTVSDNTFDMYEEGDYITLQVRANPYCLNGRAGISLVEQE